LDAETRSRIGPIWEKLDGGLWHTTSQERYESITKSGGISPEPPSVPDNDRYGTRDGAETYPLVRHLGGVSLFDLKGFEVTSYSQKYPVSSWSEFMPFRRAWGGAVWIGIDRDAVAANLISAAELKRIAEEEHKLNRNRMPGIEVGHRGVIPVSAFREAWFVNACGVEPRPIK